MKPAIIVFSILMLPVSSQADTYETPASLLKRLPTLPLEIQGANCEAGKQIALRAEEINARYLQQLAPAAYMAHAAGGMAVTDKQGNAISKLADEELVQCLFNVSMGQELVNNQKQSLQQSLGKLEEQRRADEGRCGSGIGADSSCLNRVAKDYQKKANTMANNFLKNLRSPFGEWEKKARHCVGLRDAAAKAVLTSGIKGPFLTQAHAVRVQSYVLPRLLGESWHQLCEAAVEAGNSMNTN